MWQIVLTHIWQLFWHILDNHLSKPCQIILSFYCQGGGTPLPPTRIYVSILDISLTCRSDPFSIPLKFFEILLPQKFWDHSTTYYMERISKPLFSLDQTAYKCPQCAAPIHWSCNGKTGYAHCGNSPQATRMWKRGEHDKLKVCDWEGYCKRRPNGSIEIYYYP